jgi:ADP-ribose pyrophosphatase YjhB (NUDIX family)
MNHDNTNWGQSVTGVVLKDGKVLLARHTYGAGNGKLIIPGGYVNFGETPQEALVREYMEETHVKVNPLEVIGIRFNMHDWYVAFLDVDEALSREDVPELTKKLIRSALSKKQGLHYEEYVGSTKHAPYALYCL